MAFINSDPDPEHRKAFYYLYFYECYSRLCRRDEDRDDTLESPAKRMRLSTDQEEEEAAGPCDSADGATPTLVGKTKQ